MPGKTQARRAAGATHRRGQRAGRQFAQGTQQRQSGTSKKILPLGSAPAAAGIAPGETLHHEAKPTARGEVDAALSSVSDGRACRASLCVRQVIVGCTRTSGHTHTTQHTQPASQPASQPGSQPARSVTQRRTCSELPEGREKLPSGEMPTELLWLIVRDRLLPSGPARAQLLKQG